MFVHGLAIFYLYLYQLHRQQQVIKQNEIISTFNYIYNDSKDHSSWSFYHVNFDTHIILFSNQCNLFLLF